MIKTTSALLSFLLGSALLSAQTRGNCMVRTVAGSPTTDAGDDGPAVSAQLFGPQSIAGDLQGNIYIADTGNWRVRKVSPNGTIITVAGSGVRGDDGDGGPASKARLMTPSGIVVDGSGALYIADSDAHRIRKVSTDGTITTIAGTGSPGFSGDGGPPATAQLNHPRRVAVDGGGRVYIADGGNGRIRRVDPDGTIRTIAGRGLVENIESERGDGGPATGAGFQFVDDIAADAAGILYVSDPGDGRIRRIGPDGVIRTAVGPVNGSSPPAEGISALSVRFTIESMSVDPNGTIFVMEGAYTAPIWRIGPDEIFHRVPSDLYSIYQLSLLFASPSGALYQTGLNDTVWKIVNGTATLVAGVGTEGYSGDGGPATSATLRAPSGLALDAGSNLFIADWSDSRVRKVGPTGAIATVAGNGRQPAAPDDTGDGGPATQAPLGGPNRLAVDPTGNLIIGDADGHRLRKVNPDGVISTLAGNGGYGGDRFFPLDLRSFPATSISININGLAVDSKGDVYLADASFVTDPFGYNPTGAIFRIRPDGTASYFAEFLPYSSTITYDGELFIDKNDNLFALTEQSWNIEKIAPDGQSSTPLAISGSYATYLSAFTFDKAGNLFVAGRQGAIRRIAPNGAVSTVLGGDSRNVTNSDGPAFQNAVPRFISGMAADNAGNLYFSDPVRSRVRMIPEASTCQGAIYPLIATYGIVNSASYFAGLAPGEIIAIFGANLGPEQPAYANWGPDGRLATNIGGTRVLFDGVPAPMIYASAGQVNAIVPYEVYGKAVVNVAVEFNGFPSEDSLWGVSSANPGIFVLDASGTGQAAALNADSSLNGPANPAARGSVISLYATGEGQTEPPGVTGAPVAGVLPKPKLPVVVRIGGVQADVPYAGGAPGFAAGVLQVNAKVPESVAAGPAVPVQLVIGDKASYRSVTIAVK